MPLPAPFSFRLPAAGIAWLRPVAMAVAGCVAATSAAAAESAVLRAAPSVIVDWSVFDSLGKAPLHPGLAPVVLQPPPASSAAATPAPLPIRESVPPASSPQPPPPAASVAMSGLGARPPQPAAAAVMRAALAPAPLPGYVSEVRFAAGSVDLSPEARQFLDAVAHALAGNARLRVQLVAHAGGDGDAIAARRLSLVRAVEMRSYLLDKGVDGARMDVRALGNRNDNGEGSLDRVDVTVLDR